MTTTWNVSIGQKTEAISKDLLLLLNFSPPYRNDPNNMANLDQHTSRAPLALLAEAYSHGLSEDAAALYAIRLRNERQAAQSEQTARQKVAQIELQAAEEHRTAEGIALARARLIAGK